jgi:hypothetical protein
MRQWIRSHLTYANVLSTLAVFLILGGGVAYAANTVFSSDIVDNQVYSADVRNDSLAGGGLQQRDLQLGSVGSSEVLDDTSSGGGLAARDLRSGSVGPAEAAGLGSADIANTGSGSDDINANKLDGIDSSGLVQGHGTLLSNRIVFPVGNEKTLLQIPGLGELRATCSFADAHVNWNNLTNSTIDWWRQGPTGDWGAGLAPPGGLVQFVATRNAGGTLGLGLGNDPGSRTIATVHAFAFEGGDNGPCGFQAQATLWTSG